MQLQRIILQVLILAMVSISGCSSSGQTIHPSQPDDPKKEKDLVQLGAIESNAISESSGLVRSKRYPDHFWTLNDSGQTNDVFLISASGKTKARVELKGAKNIDWETMTWLDIGNRRRLIVGDVGDNGKRRKDCQLYFFDEPELKLDKKNDIKAKTDVERVDFEYADGPINCEAMACLPSGNEIWLVEKGFSTSPRAVIGIMDGPGPGIYSVKLQLDKGNTKQKLIARRIASFPMLQVTGMDFSPDGNQLIVRSYFVAFHFFKAKDKSWVETIKSSSPTTIALPIQIQGESICFTDDSKSVVVTSEGSNQPIWQVNLETQLSRAKKQADIEQQPKTLKSTSDN